MKANEAALDGYRLGWASGDTDAILGVFTNKFNFTWVQTSFLYSWSMLPATVSRHSSTVMSCLAS